MRTKNRILLESKVWAEEKLSSDSDYFAQLSKLNNPRILWLASSDSIVPVQELINAEPGSVQVYSNIGIQVRHDDLSLMAIVEEAIELFGIKHIVVCGYSNCGGIRRVIDGAANTPAAKEWLKFMSEVYEEHKNELSLLPRDQQEKFLNELNIRQQVANLSSLPIIQKAWEKTDYPKIFGWYFDLMSGALKEVYSMENNHRIHQVATLVENVNG